MHARIRRHENIYFTLHWWITNFVGLTLLRETGMACLLSSAWTISINILLLSFIRILTSLPVIPLHRLREVFETETYKNICPQHRSLERLDGLSFDFNRMWMRMNLLKNSPAWKQEKFYSDWRSWSYFSLATSKLLIYKRYCTGAAFPVILVLSYCFWCH